MSIQHIRRSVLVAATVGALAFAGLFAGQLFARGPGAGFGGGAFGPRMFNHMARALDLTDAQKAQVKGILRSHLTELETQATASSSARVALHDAIHAQPVNEQLIRTKAMELGAVHAEGAVLFAKIRAEILPILTEDQKTKMQTMHERMKQRGQDGAKALENWLRSDS